MVLATVTVEQLFDFILAQPDDKPINFDQADYRSDRPASENGCGCLYLQYILFNFPPPEELVCGVRTASYYLEESLDPQSIEFAMPYSRFGTNHTTYRTLKERVRESLNGIGQAVK